MQIRFGEAVGIEYFDLADEGAGERFGDLLRLAEERGFAFPLIAINGQLRLAGSAHYFQILPLVEAALAIEPVAPQEAAPGAS